MTMIFDDDMLALKNGNADHSGESCEKTFVLAIGESGNWHTAGPDLPFNYKIGFAEFRDVTQTLVGTLLPDIIMSPLYSSTFDCVDLATKLHKIGYKGRYQVVTRQLPNPGIISAEIRTLCPGLNFALVLSNAEASIRLN